MNHAKMSSSGGSSSAAAGVEQPPDGLHRRNAAFNHVCQRCAPSEDAVRIRKLDPIVRQILRVKNIQSLEDSNQVGDAIHLVGIEDLASRILLHFKEGSIGNSAQ